MKCTCYIKEDDGVEPQLIKCPLCKAAPKFYKALLAVYQDIELQNVEGGSAELNIMVQQALSKVERS